MGCCRTYTVVLRTPTGEVVTVVEDDILMHLVLGVHGAGELALEIGGCDLECVEICDGMRVEVWGSCDGGPNQLIGRAPFLVDYAAFVRTGFDEKRLRLLGIQPTGWLARRIVPYPKEHVWTFAAGTPAERLIKRIAVQNWGPGASSYPFVGSDAVRDASGWIGVAPDLGRGAPIFLEYAHMNLLDLFQEIAWQSAAAGQPIYFIIEQVGTGNGVPYMQLEVYEGQIGVDRTQTSGLMQDMVVLTPENETISDYELVWDWRTCLNRGYAGESSGKDTDDYSAITAADMAAQLAKNPLALREGFQAVAGLKALQDATGLDKAQVLANKARGLLAVNACTEQVKATVAETDGFCFLCDWNWGDKVTVAVECRVFDAMIDSLEILWENGREQIDARVGGGVAGSARGLENLLQRVARTERELRRVQGQVF